MIGPAVAMRARRPCVCQGMRQQDAALNAGGGAEPTHGLTFSSKQNLEDRRIWDSTVCPSTRRNALKRPLKPCPPAYLQILYHDPGEAPAHETAGPRTCPLTTTPCAMHPTNEQFLVQARARRDGELGSARDQPILGTNQPVALY